MRLRRARSRRVSRSAMTSALPAGRPVRSCRSISAAYASGASSAQHARFFPGSKPITDPRIPQSSSRASQRHLIEITFPTSFGASPGRRGGFPALETIGIQPQRGCGTQPRVSDQRERHPGQEGQTRRTLKGYHNPLVALGPPFCNPFRVGVIVLAAPRAARFALALGSVLQRLRRSHAVHSRLRESRRPETP